MGFLTAADGLGPGEHPAIKAMRRMNVQLGRMAAFMFVREKGFGVWRGVPSLPAAALGSWSRARWYRVYLDSFAVANHDLAQDSRLEKRQNARLGGTGLESTYATPELQVVCRRL